jgi:hypothetical protein
MEIDVGAQAGNRQLNRRVAITVVALSVLAGVCAIKDGQVVQTMRRTQANAADRWNAYQAAHTRLHLAEASRLQISVLAPDPATAAPALRRLDRDLARYRGEAPRLAEQAKRQRMLYDALASHDDQLDASAAATTTAIALAAVAALVESAWLLYLAWAVGAFGLLMGLCGCLGWGFHPELLSRLFG